jgi:PAS domain S-box-containing protein
MGAAHAGPLGRHAAHRELEEGGLMPRPLLNRALLAITATLTIGLALGAWRIADSQQETETRALFEFRLREIAQALRGRMLDYEQVLRGTVGLFAASREVTAKEWQAYVRTLQLESSYPGIQGLGYAAYVRNGTTFTVPVRYIEPLTRDNRQVLGFDVLTEPERGRAVLRARDTAEAVLTGRLTLRSESSGASRQPAFILFLPLYRGGAAPATLEERRARFAGVVFAAFRTTDFFRGTIGEPQGLNLRLLDATDPAAPQPLYEDEREAGRAPRFELVETIAVRGRTWRLEARSRPAFEALYIGDRGRVVLSAALALGALLTALVWSLLNTRDRARELARGMVAASEERDRFRSAVDRHWDTMLMADAGRMRLVYANEGACRTLGYTREELIGASAAIVFADRDERQLAREYAALASFEGPSGVERGQFRRKDGGIVPMEITRQLFRTPAGTFVLGIGRDITERLAAERSLRESEARLALSLESSGLALFDWDLASGLVHLGKEWQAILGGRPEATVTPIQKLETLVHADDLPALRGQLRRVLKGEIDAYRVEHRVRTLDGRWTWIESVAKVSGRDAAGRAIRITGTNADISERKAVGELKNAFIANVSHELRTPLTGIVSSLDLLHEGAAGTLPEQAQKFVEIAHGNSERLSRLIDDILDLEQVESGRMRLSMQAIPAAEVLATTVQLNSAYAEQYAARLVPQAVPAEVRVNADRDRLLQVLANLVSNAAKHSPPGGAITLGVEHDAHRVVFSVADQGPGIPAQFQPRLFGKFEQADPSKTGTGLGLAIAKAMVEKMGGSIRFSSPPGRGATFYVELARASG